MNGALLKKAARALFPGVGDEWRQLFSDRFAVTRRRLQRMQKDETPIADELRDEIYNALNAAAFGITKDQRLIVQVIMEIEDEIQCQKSP